VDLDVVGGKKMFHENEIVMLLLGVGVLIFILGNRFKLKRLPSSNFLICGFYLLLAGWIATVLEGFLWSVFFNYFEHICYAGSSLLMLVWFLRVFKSKKEANDAPHSNP